MSMTSIRQINGGEELQGDVRALLNIVGKDKEAFFNEILSWLLSEAPQDFNPEILRSSKLVKLVGSAIEVNSGNNEPANNNAYLSFIEENNESFTLKVGNSNPLWDGVIEYSTDTSAWTIWDGAEISSSNDGKLYLRGKENTKVTDSPAHFVLDDYKSGKRIQCVGNIENLLDYKTVEAGEHPVMGDKCYSFMFYDCKSLVSAPILAAKKLSSQCYDRMFYKCTSLTMAPELPATELANYCYEYMFMECTSLVSVPDFPVATLAPACCRGMFTGCSALKTAPNLPATTLVSSCYDHMFINCTSLITAPDLPATTLVPECYSYMFAGCPKLTGTIHCPAVTYSSNYKLLMSRDYPNSLNVVYDL